MMVAETKLIRPRLPRGVVENPARLALLDESRGQRVMLVCGPAGYGKTTLVSHWLEQRRPAYAWLALESGDNRPLVFWDAVFAALATVDGRFDRFRSTLLDIFQGQAGQQAVDRLIADLAEYFRTWQAPERLYLVLDDFHLIDDPELLRQFRHFLDFAPAALRVMLISRNEPAIGVAQLMAREQLAYVGVERLRFDLDMTRAFLQQRLGADLPTDRVRVLHARTGGWPAVLQLITLSRRVTDGPLSLLQEELGSDGALSDYLLDEVIRQMPEDEQAFLHDMSLLPVFSAELADEIRERNDSTALLQRLGRQNLLLQHLGEAGHWYRLHDLLRDWLLAHPPDVARKHRIRRRAARALSERGRVGEALELYLEEGCYEQAERLLPQAIEYWLGQGYLSGQRDLAQRFPAAIRDRSASLHLIQAFLAFMDGHFEESLQILDDCERLLDQARPEESSLREAVLLLRCQGARYCGRPETARRLIREVEAGLGHSLSRFRAWTFYTLGVDAMIEAEMDRAYRHLQSAIENARGLGDWVCMVRSLALLVPVEIQRTEVNNAWRLFHEVRGELGHLCLGDDEQALLAHQEALLNLESDEPERARACIDRALELAGNRMTPMDRMYLMFENLRLGLIQGDGDRSWQSLEALRRLHHDQGGPWTLNIPDIPALEALLAVRQGHLQPLVHWALKTEATPEGTRFRELHERLIRLHGLRLAGKLDPNALQRLACDAAEGQVYIVVARVRLLEIMVLWYDEGAHQKALRAFLELLDTYWPRGCRRLFLDDRALLLPIVRSAARLAPEDARLQALSARLAGEELRSARPPEDVSAREREVLSLLASGLSNRDLAERMGITASTVKAHLRNIYAKLGVTNRTESVAQARSLGLIE